MRQHSVPLCSSDSQQRLRLFLQRLDDLRLRSALCLKTCHQVWFDILTCWSNTYSLRNMRNSWTGRRRWAWQTGFRDQSGFISRFLRCSSGGVQSPAADQTQTGRIPALTLWNPNQRAFIYLMALTISPMLVHISFMTINCKFSSDLFMLFL